MSDYPEEFRALDEAVTRNMRLLKDLDPHIRQAIGVSEEAELSYDNTLLTLDGPPYYTMDGKKRTVYKFSVNIIQKEEG